MQFQFSDRLSYHNNYMSHYTMLSQYGNRMRLLKIKNKLDI